MGNLVLLAHRSFHLHLCYRDRVWSLFLLSWWQICGCYPFTKFCSSTKFAEALGPLHIGVLAFGIADWSIMFGQLKEVRVWSTFLLRDFVGLIWHAAAQWPLFLLGWLYKMTAPIVKGATTTMQDGFYGYLPCLGSMFSTEITSHLATMVTVPFLMSCYHQYVYKGFTGRL